MKDFNTIWLTSMILIQRISKVMMYTITFRYPPNWYDSKFRDWLTRIVYREGNGKHETQWTENGLVLTLQLIQMESDILVRVNSRNRTCTLNEIGFIHFAGKHYSQWILELSMWNWETVKELNSKAKTEGTIIYVKQSI